ncbi:MAG TPA: hypothetical protein VMF53_08880 [Alphaproteobacteria bacterium]|nr:hypothetical protein [Alphaproteobacteria bacterium]
MDAMEPKAAAAARAGAALGLDSLGPSPLRVGMSFAAKGLAPVGAAIGAAGLEAGITRLPALEGGLAVRAAVGLASGHGAPLL